MAYVTPGTVAAGDVATAAAWNVVVGDIVDHESRIRQAAVGLVFVSGTSYTPSLSTPVPFGAENYDTDAFHDTTTNNSRITIPTGLGGTYMFEVCLMVNYSTQPTFVEINLRANGTMESSKAIRGGIYQWPTGNSANQHFKVSGIAYNCVATDYFDVCFSITGGSVSATPLTGSTTTSSPTYFRATRIAAA